MRNIIPLLAILFLILFVRSILKKNISNFGSADKERVNVDEKSVDYSGFSSERMKFQYLIVIVVIVLIVVQILFLVFK